MPCVVTDNQDGSYELDCPGSDAVTITDGTDGANGEPCTVTDQGDGSYTVACPESSPITLRDGNDAVPCSVTDHGNGSYTLACPGSDAVLIQNGADGQDGEDGGVCTMSPSGDDYVLTCPGSDPVVIHDGQDGQNGAPGQDGEDGATCSVAANGDGSYTLSCDGSAPVTFTNGAPVGNTGQTEPGAPCPLRPDALCMNVDLQYMWLADMDLRRVNFSNSDADNARWDDALLEGAIFFSVSLGYDVMKGVAATNANFIAASMFRAIATDAVFDGADFTDAYLAGTDFAGSSLQNATFIRTDLSGSYGGAEFVNANLSGANFREAELEAYSTTQSSWAVLDGAYLYDADFTGATFASNANYYTTFIGADLTCARFDADVGTMTIDWTGATCPDGADEGGDGCADQLTRGPGCPP